MNANFLLDLFPMKIEFLIILSAPILMAAALLIVDRVGLLTKRRIRPF